MKNLHPYHLVDMSPWPIITATNMLCIMLGLIQWMHTSSLTFLSNSSILLSLTAILWWRDVIRESTYLGLHTKKVMQGLKMGMILFIISEVMFFFSFFWMFFHSSTSPSIEIGATWPPIYIEPFNPLALPLLNTAILLASGVSLTWAHYNLIKSKPQESYFAMIITIILGVMFTMTQAFEYYYAPFTISSTVYGSSFFIMTGFHGLHVIIGAIFLTITAMRLKSLHFSPNHHIGFEFSAWYWHFVDVVWLFLYTALYWWGS